LRQLLGVQVTQKGSLVIDDRLRFDFSYPQALTALQIKTLEEKINEQVRENLCVQTQIMALEEAKKQGTIALFGEKYSEQVRVLSMGEFSAELCGGTHVNNTGKIGLFKIISETGVAAGIRRIEAVTGHYAIAWLQALEAQLDEASQWLKTDRNHFKEKLLQVLERNRQLEKENERLQQKNAYAQLDELIKQVKDVHGVKVLANNLHNLDAKTLRTSLDRLKQKLKSAVLVLASVEEGKITLVCSVTADCVEKINAGELLAYVAEQVAGKAGGRADMAQGGGTNTVALPAALQSVYSWVGNKLCP
jgi:alanyl-tRNA synthetase